MRRCRQKWGGTIPIGIGIGQSEGGFTIGAIGIKDLEARDILTALIHARLAQHDLGIAPELDEDAVTVVARHIRVLVPVHADEVQVVMGPAGRVGCQRLSQLASSRRWKGPEITAAHRFLVWYGDDSYRLLLSPHRHLQGSTHGAMNSVCLAIRAFGKIDDGPPTYQRWLANESQTTH